MRRWGTILPLMLALTVRAELVHVYQETLAGGARTQISDETKETGSTYSTVTAPAKSGYIFTHWSISTTQTITDRDRLGRAKDAASYTLYEETTLTANYLPESQDSDGDGVADGWEIYWYGDLSKNAASNTDGDGYSFAEELSAGTTPLMVDESLAGGIAWADGELLQYNPDNLQAYTIRSEPEGALFATVSDYLPVGTAIPIPSTGATLAYWTVDGVRQADRHGRAKDTLSIAMPSTAIEIVAVTESDEARRNALYWYGDASVSMESDTDGDGFTFAEELAAGTNPLMADESLAGGIAWADGELLQYNPYNLHPYVVRSEPEGALFATVSDYLEPGQLIPIAYSGTQGTGFAYWTVDGVRQADRHGRALDTLSIAMPSNAIEIVAISESDYNRRMGLYWYGDAEMSAESDTDGDGYTFAEELAAGTDPLMADESLAGGIAWADGELLEVNLQPYEQMRGAVVDGSYQELFTSPVAGNGGTSRTFDGAATPTVVDLNGDGLFDMVVETSKGTRTVFLNEGNMGNPRFREVAWDAKWYDALAAANTNTLDGLTFDVPPVNAVSWTFADVDRDRVEDLLVADADGRIWFYKGVAGDTNNQQLTTNHYILQHKVWGGSFAGFAQGLKISAVDWNDDGDVDLVCGTADGKLILLSDPRIGRPTGLMAETGATSVVLTWDASDNSRVRGYGVYRSADSSAFAQIEGLCPIPRYRDTPPEIHDWWYQVTGKSRFYVTGNSAPMESETEPSAPVRVSFGAVNVWLNDASSFTDTNVTVVVSMNNTMGLAANGFSMSFTYDASVLEPVEMKRTGLTKNLEFSGEPPSPATAGAWTLSATGGEIGVGAGEFMRLVFHVKPVHDVTETTVSLTAATVKTTDGQSVAVDVPKSAKIEISDANPLQPAIVSVQAGNVSVETGDEFGLPFTITSSEVLTSGVFTVTYDGAMLEWKGTEATEGTEGTLRTVTMAVTKSGTLPFKALEKHSAVTNFATVVSISGFAVVDCNGFAVTADDSQGTVLIKNAHPILPAVVSVATEDRKVDTLDTVTVPFKMISSEVLASGQFTVEWDAAALELAGTDGTIGTSGTGNSLAVSATGDFSLAFLAKDQHAITNTSVRLTAATVTDVNGFTVLPTVPVVSTILIHDANPLMPAEVAVKAGTVAADTMTTFAIPVAITSSKVLTNFCVRVGWDDAILEYRGITGATFSDGLVSATGAVPDSFTLVFYAKDQHSVTETAITLSDGAAMCTDGLAANVTLANGKVILTDSNPPVPVNMAVATLDASASSGKPFVVQFKATGDGDLAGVVATVEWDPSLLAFDGAAGATVSGLSAGSATLAFAATGAENTYNLDFTAATISGLKTNTFIRTTSASATGANGLAANLKTELPAESSVIIVRTIDKYDPGDINGDGKYTMADFELLTKYLVYLTRPSFPPYGAHKLAGNALKAADVNCDGKVNLDDRALLERLVAETAEGGAE